MNVWLEQRHLMQCPTCSSELVTGQKYCPQCGTNVAALTLPVPPAGPIAFAPPAHDPPAADDDGPAAQSSAAPPTVIGPLAPLAPPPTDTFAVVEQTVPITTTPDTASTPKSPPTNPINPIATTEPTEPPSGEVPQWVNRWSVPTEPEPPATQQTQYDQTQYDQTRYDQTRYDQPSYDETQFVETNQHEVQAAVPRSQLIIGPPTTAVPYPAGYAPGAVGVPGRGSMVLAVIAGLAGVAAIIGAFVPVLQISTDAPIPEAGDYKLNDLFLGTNMIIGAIIIGVCLLAGGILATQGKRIGAGLASGAAVALAPVLVIVWGGIDRMSQSAEAHAVATASAGQGGTFFQAKQGAGLWVLIGAAALGLIGLVIALVQAGADGRPPLNMFVGLGGALAAVVAALGQMIPSDARSFGDNFDNSLATNTILYGRLAMIALVAAAGAVGFLCNNRWGIGLALGGVAFWAWQWLSSLAEIGDSPLSPGFVPVSTLDGKPHIVTTIGVVAVLVLAVVAILAAPKNRTLAG